MLIVDPDRELGVAGPDGDFAARCTAQRLAAGVLSVRRVLQHAEHPQRIVQLVPPQVTLMARLQRLPGQAAEPAAVHVHLRVPAEIDLVPAGGRLDETCTQLMLERVAQARAVPSGSGAFPGGPGGKPDEPASRPWATPFLPLRADDVGVYPELDPRPLRCQRGLRAGDDLADGRGVPRLLPGVHFASSYAVRFTGAGHPRAGCLLAGAIPGHCVSLRQGPTHPARAIALHSREGASQRPLSSSPGP